MSEIIEFARPVRPGAETAAVCTWQIDVASRSISNGTVERRLSPRAIRLLEVLSDADGAVVRRQALMDAIWPGVTVGDESLTQVVAEVRRAVGDRPGRPRLVETVPRSGYRLTAPVRLNAPQDRAAFEARVRGDDAIFDLEAYRLCLDARRLLSRGAPDAFETAEAMAREAARRAPGFALAQAQCAIMQVQRHLFRNDGVDRIPEALERARTAVRLRSDQAACHTALGFVLGAMERWSDAKTAFGHALFRDCADPEAHYLAARTLFAAADHRAAAALAERAADLDLDDYRALFLAARAAAVFDAERGRRNAETALERVRARLSRDPSEPRALNALGPLMAIGGSVDGAVAALGSDVSAGSPLEFYTAVTRAAVDDTVGAMDALESVAETGWRFPAWLRAEPAIARLAGERRYQRFSRSLGAG